MAYTKQLWQDNDSTKPLSAARLNYIEQGIADAHALGLPTGGATGYVLTKTAATDYAVAWQASSASSARSGVVSFLLMGA